MKANEKDGAHLGVPTLREFIQDRFDIFYIVDSSAIRAFFAKGHRALWK